MKVSMGNQRYPGLEHPEVFLGHEVSPREWERILREAFGDGICVLKTWSSKEIASEQEQTLAAEQLTEHLAG